MKAKHIQFLRAYRFPSTGGQAVEDLRDVECQWQGGVLAIDMGEEVHQIPANHVHRVIVAKDDVAKGKK